MSKRKSRLSNEDVIAAMATRDIYLYQLNCVSRPSYFDVCYDYIINNELDGNALKQIKTISRKSSYNNSAQHERVTEITASNRGEEIFVLDMFKKNADTTGVFGELLDYQVPLKNARNDRGAGKIDFVSVNAGKFWIVEVKADYSKESILKAILEIQTYYQIIDRKKLLNDFNNDGLAIQKVIALFKGTTAYEQLKNEKVKHLLELFDIKIVALDRKPTVQLA